MPFAPQFSEPLTSTPAANNPATVTFPNPGSTNRIHIVSVLASYSAAPTGGQLTISDGTITVTLDVPAAGVMPPLNQTDLRFSAGAAVTVTLAAGGAGVLGKLAVVATFEF